MPRVFVFCLLALGALAIAPPAARADDLLFETLDPRRLGAAEARLLQTALAAAGDYADPPDGAWGPVSQAALEFYAAREFDDAPRNLYAGALLIGLMDVVEAGSWASRHLAPLGISLALPAGFGDGDGRAWSSPGGTLAVRALDLDAAGAAALHAEAVAAGDAAALRTLRRDGLTVTEGRLGDGRRFHLRSDRVGGRWPTVRIDGGPEDAGDLDLIRASIRPGPPALWDLPAGSYLEAIVAGTLDLLEEPWDVFPAQPASAPPQNAALPPAGPEVEATGSGFYIAQRLLVTAEHVVRGCDRVALADGTPLAVVAADANLDVAALAAPAPAGVWLSLGRADATRLGERVHAAGFPYYSIAGTSLHLTGGNVSALAGVDDDRRFFSFTAPIQPGNSGGPLIDGDGDVLGVVVSRLSESYIAETTGSMPQNINYALSTAELAGFLGRAGIRTASGGLGSFDMDRGAPDGFEAAVVPILCR